MTAKIEFQNDISIITLDDGKANVFSQEMLESLYECLSKYRKTKDVWLSLVEKECFLQDLT